MEWAEAPRAQIKGDKRKARKRKRDESQKKREGGKRRRKEPVKQGAIPRKRV